MNKKVLRERRTKFLALLMSLLMVFSLLPIEALAYDCTTDGNEQAHYFGSDSRTEEIPATCISPKKSARIVLTHPLLPERHVLATKMK